MQAIEIGAEALKLNEEDRADLVSLILDSIEGPDPNDAGSNSLEEAIKRGEELKSGAVGGVPEKVFLDEFRNLRAK